MRILLVVYDQDAYTHWFPHGLAYIAAALRQAGHEVCVYSQDQFHWPESHLKKYLIDNEPDVVAVSLIAGYYQYKKIQKISKAINSVPKRPIYILGGHGPSPVPEFWLKKTGADFIVHGEGEITAVKLLDVLGKKKSGNGNIVSKVEGISYLENGKLVKTAERKLIKQDELVSIPFPAWDLFPMDYYAMLQFPFMTAGDRSMQVITARGCPFHCNFCYRMDKGTRLRPIEDVIEEIRQLKERYNITYINFADELTMVGVKRTEELCHAIMDSGLDIKWALEGSGRLNYAKPKLLALMKKAGCVFIGYGVESVDDDTLKRMNKNLTRKQIIEGVEATRKAGIGVGMFMIFGNIDENKETLQKAVDFLLKYDDQSQLRTIRAITPYPGSPLYYYALEKGLLKDAADFYDNKHVNSDLLSVNFTQLSDEEFHSSLCEANKILLRNYYNRILERAIEQTEELYLEKDITFRGYRHAKHN